MTKKDMRCKVCGKAPGEISSVIQFAKMEDLTPEEFIEQEEGTYNETSREFYCNECYIKIGMPLGTA